MAEPLPPSGNGEAEWETGDPWRQVDAEFINHRLVIPIGNSPTEDTPPLFTDANTPRTFFSKAKKKLGFILGTNPVVHETVLSSSKLSLTDSSFGYSTLTKDTGPTLTFHASYIDAGDLRVTSLVHNDNINLRGAWTTFSANPPTQQGSIWVSA